MKDPDAEDRAIEDIALAVRGFFIKSSKWSSSVGEDKVVYVMRENLEYDEEFAEDQEKGNQLTQYFKTGKAYSAIGTSVPFIS